MAAPVELQRESSERQHEEDDRVLAQCEPPSDRDRWKLSVAPPQYVSVKCLVQLFNRTDLSSE